MHSFTHTTTATNPHIDAAAAVMGIICTFAVLLFLIALTATGYYFIYKNITTKKGAPTVLSCVRDV